MGHLAIYQGLYWTQQVRSSLYHSTVPEGKERPSEATALELGPEGGWLGTLWTKERRVSRASFGWRDGKQRIGLRGMWEEGGHCGAPCRPARCQESIRHGGREAGAPGRLRQ